MVEEEVVRFVGEKKVFLEEGRVCVRVGGGWMEELFGLFG